MIMQTVTERVLEQFAADLGVTVQWSTEVVGVDQDDDAVSVETRGPHGVARRRARYLVGCDGGHSSVRGCTGISFNGTDSRFITLLGDVDIDDPPADRFFLQRRPAGLFSLLEAALHPLALPPDRRSSRARSKQDPIC
jgi:2-polyprenyl-6-methoxyphenol hydroxylase-like FAD-dependent oxidoreductase